MRILHILLCTGIALAKVLHVPYQSGLVLRPNQSYTLHVDAAQPTEIGWRAVQPKPCTTKCVQVTEFRDVGSYSIATGMGSSQKYRPVDGKISVEYKNVSSEPVTIDIFRIDRTCDAEACRFLDQTKQPRSLVFLVDEFKSITTSPVHSRNMNRESTFPTESAVHRGGLHVQVGSLSAHRAVAWEPIMAVQWAHRRAAMGTSLRHSGHFLVVGSAGAGGFLRRDVIAFIGTTTKK